MWDLTYQFLIIAYLFTLPLKSSVSIMQTNLKILVFRNQDLLQQMRYINEFIHSYSQVLCSVAVVKRLPVHQP